MKRLLLIFAFALLCTFGNLFAAVPTSFNYQGVLVDNNNLPFPNGTQDISFKLYPSAVGGTVVSQHSATVTLENGYFNTLVDGINPLDFDQDIWVEIYVKVNGVDTPVGPRVKLTSVPYAIRAEIANSAVTAVKADTATFATSAATATFATNAHLADSAGFAVPIGKADGINSDIIGNYPNGLKIKEEALQGLIHSAIGTIGGDVSGTSLNLIRINEGVIETKHLSDNSVVNSKIAPGAITADKIANGTITVANLNPTEFQYWDKDYRNDVQIDTDFNGDVTGKYNTIKIKPGVVTDTELNTVEGLTAGTYNSNSKIYGFDVNAKGRVTKVYENNLTASAIIPGAPGQVVATGADGATAWKSLMIDENQLVGNGITSALDIKAGGIGSNEIADGSILAADVSAEIATTAQLNEQKQRITDANAAIAQEILDRANGDTDVIGLFMNADNGLHTEIRDSILVERTARIAGDGVNKTAIDDETAARVLAVNAERDARIAADDLKQDKALATGKVWIGDVNGSAAPQNLKGDVLLAADGTVEIQPSTITGVEIADGAVSNSELSNLSISTEKVRDRAITPTKLEGTLFPNQYLMSDGIGGVTWNDGNFKLPYKGDYTPDGNADFGGFKATRKVNPDYDQNNLSTYSYASAIRGVNESPDGYAGFFSSSMVNPYSSTLRTHNMAGGKALEVVGNATFDGSSVEMNSTLKVSGATSSVMINNGKITGADVSTADDQYTLTTRNYVDGEILNAATDIKSYEYLTVNPVADLPNSKIIDVDANKLTINADDITKTVTIGVKTEGITANEIKDATITSAELAPTVEFVKINDNAGSGFTTTKAAPTVTFVGEGLNKDRVTVDAGAKKVIIGSRVVADESTILADLATTPVDGNQKVRLNLDKANTWVGKQTFGDAEVTGTFDADNVQVGMGGLVVAGETNFIGTVNGYESPVLNPAIDLGVHSLAVNDKNNKFSEAQSFPKDGAKGLAQRTAFVNSINAAPLTVGVDPLISGANISVDDATVKNDAITNQLYIPIDKVTIDIVGNKLEVIGSKVSNIDGTKIQGGTIPATALNVADFSNWNKDAANSVMKNTAITEAATSDATIVGNVLNGLNIQYKAKSIENADVADHAIGSYQMITNDEHFNPADANHPGVWKDDKADQAIKPYNLNKGGDGVDFSNWEKNSTQTVHTVDKILASTGDVINTTNAVYGNFSLTINPNAATGNRIIDAVNLANASTIAITKLNPTNAGTAVNKGILTTDAGVNTWSTSPALTDLTLTGKLDVNGATATIVNGIAGDLNPVKINDELTVTGLSTLTGATLPTGNLTLATGNVVITAGNLNVTAGTTNLNGATTIGGVTQINNNLTVDNHPVALGGTLGVTGATILASTLDVAGAVSNGVLGGVALNLNDDVTIGGKLDVTGATTLASTLEVKGATTTLTNSNLITAGTSVIKNDGVVGNGTAVNIADDLAVAGNLTITSPSTLTVVGGGNIGGVTFGNNNGSISGANLSLSQSANITQNLTVGGILNAGELHAAAFSATSLTVTGATALGSSVSYSKNDPSFASPFTTANLNTAFNAPTGQKTIVKWSDPVGITMQSQLPAGAEGQILMIYCGQMSSILNNTVDVNEIAMLVFVNGGWRFVK